MVWVTLIILSDVVIIMSNKLKEKKFKNIRQKEWGREGLQRSNLLRIRIASNSDCFIRRGSSRKLGYSKLDKSTNKRYNTSFLPCLGEFLEVVFVNLYRLEFVSFSFFLSFLFFFKHPPFN